MTRSPYSRLIGVTEQVTGCHAHALGNTNVPELRQHSYPSRIQQIEIGHQPVEVDSNNLRKRPTFTVAAVQFFYSLQSDCQIHLLGQHNQADRKSFLFTLCANFPSRLESHSDYQVNRNFYNPV